jgi:primosomal replication protein N
VLIGGAVRAHHAFDTEFDANKPVTLRGVVTKVEWTNPHVWFYLNVKNDKTGETENWGFEMGGVRQLQQQGWNRNTIQIGSELIVDGFLARNGSRNVNSKNVTLTNGQKLGAASSQGQQLP